MVLIDQENFVNYSLIFIFKGMLYFYTSINNWWSVFLLVPLPSFSRSWLSALKFTLTPFDISLSYLVFKLANRSSNIWRSFLSLANWSCRSKEECSRFSFSSASSSSKVAILANDSDTSLARCFFSAFISSRCDWVLSRIFFTRTISCSSKDFDCSNFWIVSSS